MLYWLACTFREAAPENAEGNSKVSIKGDRIRTTFSIEEVLLNYQHP